MYVELTVVSRIEKRAQCILDGQGHPITTLPTLPYLTLITMYMYLGNNGVQSLKSKSHSQNNSTRYMVIKSFLDTLQRPMLACDPLLLSLFVPVQVSLIGTPVVYHLRRFLHA